jgi:hypothetical protein
MLPHQPGNGGPAFWGFAGTLPTQPAMGSGVAPAAALARELPAAWCQARLALAVQALALGCEAGVRHHSTTVQPWRRAH